MDDREIDEILGVIRCERCGHRLEDEIECPFCSSFGGPVKRDALSKWIYFTACFLTSPFSLYFIVKNTRLNIVEKILAASGCSLWLAIYVARL